MLKLRTILLVVMAGGILLSLPSVASAQLPQSVVDQLTPKYRNLGPCRDPWVTIAINDVFANTRTIQGQGEWGECDHSRYGKAGSWSSYAELYQSVRTVFNNTAAARLTITKQALPNGNWKIATKSGDGKFVHNDIVSHDGGTLITSDGAGLIIASVVSQGGGNVVAQGGGNVVGPGGASVVAQGGGNLVSTNGGNAVSQGGGNLLTNNGGTMTVGPRNLFAVSDNEMRVYLGGSVLILKK